MRVLVGKTFGIGNAVLSIPMIKAIRSLGHRVDVLVGTSPDDGGAAEVFQSFRNNSEEEVIGNIWKDGVPFNVEGYDVAIMSIPYDGRWQNGVHFFARTVVDCRKRPGNVERLGFDMWEKHEVEYQMENAKELGYSGPTPNCSFLPDQVRVPDRVYLGIGFKRDPGGFGQSKHFGSERFARLMEGIRRLRPSVEFVSTGSPADVVEGHYISRYCDGLFKCQQLSLSRSFDVIGSCSAYIGNDTGMMHVAASFGMPTFGLFAYPELIVKNPPFCDRSRCILFTPNGPPVEEIARQFVNFVRGAE